MPDQPQQSNAVDLMAAPSKEDLEFAKLMAPPSKDELKDAGEGRKEVSLGGGAIKVKGITYAPRKESWLYDFVTGAQGDNAVEPVTAAELLAPGAMSSSATPAQVSLAKKVLGGAVGSVLGGAGWHSGGAIARKLLGGGH